MCISNSNEYTSYNYYNISYVITKMYTFRYIFKGVHFKSYITVFYLQIFNWIYSFYSNIITINL